MPVVHQSLCRTCQEYCPTLVTVDDGKIIDITGDPTNDMYQGYACVKGRNARHMYDHPDRLLHPLKRMPDGEQRRIPLDEAIFEISERLRAVIDEFGPNSVALFRGNHSPTGHASNVAMIEAFMAALGSRMNFNVMPIDQPGKPISLALHGSWMAPGHKIGPDAVLVVGGNPLVTHTHLVGPPAEFIRDMDRRGGKLIVIDPRRSETAARAAIHLAPKAGEDAAILAGMLRVILDEGLWDREFVEENVSGLEELRKAVAPFTPAMVARRADIDSLDLERAARIFGSAKRGYVIAGTGPSMSCWSTLTEYLVRCLDTVTGHHLRAGEPVPAPVSFLPESPAKAQAIGPSAAFDESQRMRVRNLVRSAAGMPTGALSDEILMPGEGQVHALLSIGGNPATCWPDQRKTVKALRSLDLLVHVDVQMTTTARLADYVIPHPLPYELIGTNAFADFLVMFNPAWGFRRSFARYTPAIVPPPEGAELLQHWQLLYRIAQHLGLQLELYPAMGKATASGRDPVKLDMTLEPTPDELHAITFAGSRIPFEEIRSSVGGISDDAKVFVAPKDPGWSGRLDVGNALMMADLHDLACQPIDVEDDVRFPFRLLSRRLREVWNTPTYAMPAGYSRYNLLYVHPDDLAELGIRPGDLVQVQSEHGSVQAFAASDDTLRRKTVALPHNFGGLPEDGDYLGQGVNAGLLLSNDVTYEKYSGQPLMSNVPVRLSLAHDQTVRLVETD
jgi:anaerobic selenocysteine-containing dehydrogenase